MRFWIDIESPTGDKLGDGPIATATAWRHSARLDRAGEIQFVMSARDPRAALIIDHPKRIARCYGQLFPGAAVSELGAGLIESWSLKPDKNGDTQLTVAGGDLLRELTHRSVGFLALSNGAGEPIDFALALIIASAPGWSFDPSGYDETGVYDYGAYAGELVLDALAKLAAHDGQHFRLANAEVGRKVKWLRDHLVLSGMRAVQGGDGVALEDNHDVCLTEDIEEIADGYDILTRVYPFGAGNGESRLTLAHTSRSAPAGYTLDLANNCLIHTAAETALGLRIERFLAWKEIGPISNSDIDLESAANVLFDAALRELEIRSAAQRAFRLRVAKCDQILYPGQTLRVVYRGWTQLVDHTGAVTGNYHYLDIDEDLCILETQTEIDASGLRTVGLIVSTVDAWPTSEAELIADEMASGRLMEAHPQLTIAYSPVGPYTRRMDSTHHAEFVARIGSEVTTLNYAKLRFKSGPLVSSVKSMASAGGGGSTVTSSGGGGATPTSSASDPAHFHKIHVQNGAGGDSLSIDTSYPSSAALYTSGSTSDVATNSSGGGDLSHTHSVSVPDHTHDVTVPDHTHDLTTAYGIYQDTAHPTSISIYINGVDRTSALGGPWATGGAAVEAELEITPYLAEDAGGLRQNHSIEFRCTSGQGEIEAEIDMLVSIQAIAVI